MKLSKILLGSAVLAALSFGFMGCAEEDDPNEMINEVNSKQYTIEFTNSSTTAVSRGYQSTNLKHAGAIVSVNFDATSTAMGGVMGVIFDLHDNESNKKAKDFCVVGIQNTTAAAPKYYVSIYKGVTELQGDNFGAGTGDCTETVVVDAFTAVPSACVDKTAGTTVYVYFVEKETSTGSFNYEVYFLPKSVIDSLGAIKDADLGELKNTAGNVIDISSYKVATCNTAYTALQQNKFAVYANVYKSSTVKGTWLVKDTYKEAEVVED